MHGSFPELTLSPIFKLLSFGAMFLSVPMRVVKFGVVTDSFVMISSATMATAAAQGSPFASKAFKNARTASIEA